MKGDQEIIDCLNALLAGEFAARDQYFTHANQYDDLGFKRLYQQAFHESEHEAEHAKALAERILLLEGTPVAEPHGVNIGATVEEMLKNDLALEYEVQANLKAAIKLCESKFDYVSRDMLVEQLIDTEQDHAHWLEKQLGLIKLIGLQNYLQSQMKEDEVSA